MSSGGSFAMYGRRSISLNLFDESVAAFYKLINEIASLMVAAVGERLKETRRYVPSVLILDDSIRVLRES